MYEYLSMYVSTGSYPCHTFKFSTVGNGRCTNLSDLVWTPSLIFSTIVEFTNYKVFFFPGKILHLSCISYIQAVLNIQTLSILWGICWLQPSCRSSSNWKFAVSVVYSYTKFDNLSCNESSLINITYNATYTFQGANHVVALQKFILTNVPYLRSFTT
jgi:hypothetical protein